MQQRSQKTVRLLSDFDGTLTGAEGQTAFNTQLPHRIANASTPFELNQVYSEINQLIQQHPEYGITKSGVEFIKNILANPNAELVIVSRNYAAYVQALMTVAGFSDSDINRVAIYDRTSFQNKAKGDAVRAHEQAAGVTPVTIVCDDSNKDCQDMFNSTKSPGKLQVNSPMGQFDWPDITRTIGERARQHQKIPAPPTPAPERPDVHVASGQRARQHQKIPAPPPQREHTLRQSIERPKPQKSKPIPTPEMQKLFAFFRNLTKSVTKQKNEKPTVDIQHRTPRK